MTSKKTVDTVVTGDRLQLQSAVVELRKQLERGYALASSARLTLQSLSDEPDPTTIELLEMTEELLGDLQYINRLDQALASPA